MFGRREEVVSEKQCEGGQMMICEEVRCGK